MNATDEKLTIQQAAETTGLSVYTLRYYERIGLIHPIDRAENTHRRYSREDVGWIDFLNKLRAMGMSIHEMQCYTDLQRQGDCTLPERIEMLKAVRGKVEAHMRELQDHLGVICFKIEHYEALVSERIPEVC